VLANWPPADPTQMSDGISRLRETIDELYRNGMLPPADIYVAGQRVIVEISVSGANPNSFQVAVTPTTVTVAGEVPRELDLGDIQYQGIRRGDFHVALTLPVAVDPSDAQANYRDGMLTLEMARAETTAPHLVPVQYDAGAADGQQRDVAVLQRS
jgi:HSP20 family protein